MAICQVELDNVLFVYVNILMVTNKDDDRIGLEY